VIKLSQLLTALATLGAAACSKAQSQDGAAVEAKLPGGFAQLSNVVELADGRVAFAESLWVAPSAVAAPTSSERLHQAILADSSSVHSVSGWLRQGALARPDGG